MTAAEGLTGPGERIGTIAQVRGAMSRMRRAGWRLVLLWLATSAWGQGMQYGAEAVGISFARPTPDPGYLAYLAVATAVGAIIGAIGLRLLLQGPHGWLKVDEPLLRTAGLVGLASAAMIGIQTAYSWSVRGTTEAGAFMWPAMLASAGYVLVMILALKLTLWPAGVLMARADMTPTRSWRLMKRATRGLALSYVVFALPMVALAALSTYSALTMPQAPGREIYDIALQAVGVGLSFCGSALTATLYDLRVGAAATVADVFN